MTLSGPPRRLAIPCSLVSAMSELLLSQFLLSRGGNLGLSYGVCVNTHIMMRVHNVITLMFHLIGIWLIQILIPDAFYAALPTLFTGSSHGRIPIFKLAQKNFAGSHMISWLATKMKARPDGMVLMLQNHMLEIALTLVLKACTGTMNKLVCQRGCKHALIY